MPCNSVTLRLQDNRVIRWIFQYPHDFQFMTSWLLPWALPDAIRVDDTGDVDFVVAVYPHDAVQMLSDYRSGRKFIAAAEVESRYDCADAIAIVSGPRRTDDTKIHRYGPTMCCWSPPISVTSKTKVCSAIENGKYPWRATQVQQARRVIPEMEVFGQLSGRPLSGYHGVGTGPYGNDKYLALQEFAFSVGIERACADDYLTEKLTDPILCEAVPLYQGATNLWDYVIPEAVIPLDRIQMINWRNWRSLYEKIRPYVLHQKELIRTRFNIFSYFDVLTRDLSLLDSLRPITLTRPSFST